MHASANSDAAPQCWKMGCQCWSEMIKDDIPNRPNLLRALPYNSGNYTCKNRYTDNYAARYGLNTAYPGSVFSRCQRKIIRKFRDDKTLPRAKPLSPSLWNKLFEDYLTSYRRFCHYSTKSGLNCALTLSLVKHRNWVLGQKYATICAWKIRLRSVLSNPQIWKKDYVSYRPLKLSTIEQRTNNYSVAGIMTAHRGEAAALVPNDAGGADNGNGWHLSKLAFYRKVTGFRTWRLQFFEWQSLKVK